MEPEETGVLRLELKYCERCGGLWLRVRGHQGPYCSSCAAAMSDAVVVRTSKRMPRLPVRDLKGQHSGAQFLLRNGGLT
jgi:hypothetical protein